MNLIAIKKISDSTAEQRLGAMRRTGDFLVTLDSRNLRKRFEEDGTLVNRGSSWLVVEGSEVHQLAEKYFSEPKQGPRS